MLSRRLWLYRAKAPNNPLVSVFIPFALADDGQKLVKLAGFVDLSLLPEKAQIAATDAPSPAPASPGVVEPVDAGDAPPVMDDELFIDPEQVRTLLSRDDVPDGYRAIAGEADRLKVNFWFETGSDDLDTLAHADIERLIGFMASPEFQSSRILLAGFADSRGDWDYNMKLSKDRAEAVYTALKVAGLPLDQYEGFSEAVPVGSNETPEGQALNRRVEVWLKR